MDGIYNWILSVPKFVMNTKFISCGYTASSEAFNLSGELYGGPFLLIGFRSSIYASITAHSYWKDRAISVATIENGIWAKRFEKLITNNDLQKTFSHIDVNNIVNTCFGYCINCTNISPGDDGYLEVYNAIHSPGIVFQRYTPYGSHGTYNRQRLADGVWMDWAYN